MAKALTTRLITSLKPSDKRQEIPDGGTKGVGGLFLIMQASGAQSWAVRGRVRGKPIKFTIGSAQVYDLGKARDEARRVLRAMKQGIDPKAERDARELAEKRDDIANVVADFLSRHARVRTREKTWRETERIFNAYVLPEWKGRPIQSITRRDIKTLIESKARTAPSQANQILSAIKTLFSWCVKEEILAVSPAAKVEKSGPKTSRDRTLDDDELKLVWEVAGDIAAPYGHIFRLLILLATRKSDVSGMTWDEVDLAKARWALPPGRTKNHRRHVVPLSDQALALLAELAEKTHDKGHGQVFTCNGHLGPVAVSSFSRAKRELDDRITARNGVALKPWTIHDIRRTVATGLQRLGIRLEVSEAVLNHASGSISGVAAVYHRHSFDIEKRQALDAWSKHVETVVCGKAQPVVVAFPSAVA